MTTRLIFFFILYLTTASAQENTSLNLGFEIENSINEPYTWRFNKDEGAIVKCDTLHPLAGLKSLYVDTRGITSKSYLVYNYLPGAFLKGKNRIRVKAYIKCANEISPVSLLLNQQNQSNNTSVYNSSARFDSILAGGWKRYSVSVVVDTTAQQVLLAITLPKGEFWLDNVTIELDGQRVNDLPPLRIPVPTSDELSWLKKNITEIDPTSSKALSKQELSVISSQLNAAQIVALGESTHGTHEFFDIKIRMIKSLVKNYKFNVIAFEAPMAELYEVNRYIIAGMGTITSVIHGRAFYRVYDTDEVKGLIEWLRQENLTRDKKDKIHFAGIDMQGTAKAYETIKQFVPEVPALETRFQSVYNAYLSPKNRLTDKATFFRLVDSFYNAFQSVKSQLKHPNDFDLSWKEQNVELIRQEARKLYEEGIGNWKVRDSMMAKNAIWLSKNYPQAKVILWAHNSHISNSANSMGEALYRNLGDRYFTVGLFTEKGTYNTFPTSGTKTIPLVSATGETSEFYFAQLGKPAFLLSTIQAKGRLQSFSQLAIRSTGTTNTNHQFITMDKSVFNLFDAIIFIKETTPSKPKIKTE